MFSRGGGGAIAEVGLVPFAHLALEVAGAVLPPYRTRFSKHLTQPQLLAILCLMRYEDWTYQEAEVRLSEHSELRRALGLPRVPDHTTLYRFLCRLPPEALAAALAAMVRRFPRRRRARVAVDATGLSSGAVSTFFVRRLHHHTHQPLPWRHGLKRLVVVDVDQQLLLAQAARRGPWNDCAHLPALVGAPLCGARGSVWCWPRPSSTVSATTPTSVNSSGPTASSRPGAGSVVGASVESEPKCAAPSLVGSTLAARWSRASSPV